MGALVGALGVVVMVCGLGLYVGLLGLTLGSGRGRSRSGLEARLKIGSFAVIFVGAGLFVATRPADYAIPAAIGLFTMAVAVGVLSLALRVND